jgi:hypothetical protein
MTLLSDFISSERERFADDDNNKFAIGFSHISRYQLFLSVILQRYEEASRSFFENTNAMQATLLPGTHKLIDAQVRLYEDGVRLNVLVHLEIESYYLFAKIYLDKVAHALEFYFGQGRGQSLDSHDQLVKNFAAYAEEKSLALPADFMCIAAALKKDISDYRDYEIAHEKSPRRLSGTVFDAEGRMQILGISLYPTDTDKQVESKVPHDLAKDLDAYIACVIELLETNRANTKLKTAPESRS